MGDKAFITPNVLKWARESARMSEETAAARASVSVEKLREWEGGLSQPTIRQAQILAKVYIKLPFVGRFTFLDNPKIVAKDILQTFNIDPAHYKTKTPIREWLDRKLRLISNPTLSSFFVMRSQPML